MKEKNRELKKMLPFRVSNFSIEMVAMVNRASALRSLHGTARGAFDSIIRGLKKLIKAEVELSCRGETLMDEDCNNSKVQFCHACCFLVFPCVKSCL